MKGFREKATDEAMRRTGANWETAALHALALHPFDSGDPRPKSRQFTKLVRAASWNYARHSTKDGNSETMRREAERTVLIFWDAARQSREHHYIGLFEAALESTTRPEAITSPPNSEADLIAAINGPDSDMGGGLEALFETLADPSSELAQAVSSLHEVNEEECAHIVPQALEYGYSPQELYDAVLKEYGREGSPLATMARRKLWEAQLVVADRKEFERMCDGVEASLIQGTEGDSRFTLIDQQREERGLPPSPSREARSAVEAASWQRVAEKLKAQASNTSPEEFVKLMGFPSAAAAPSRADQHRSRSRRGAWVVGTVVVLASATVAVTVAGRSDGSSGVELEKPEVASPHTAERFIRNGQSWVRDWRGVECLNANTHYDENDMSVCG